MKRLSLLLVMIFMLGMVTSLLNATEVTIGAGDQQARVPVDMYWKNSLFECMYFQDELGFVSGTISGVKFYNNFVTDLPNMPTNIWLGTTTQTSFATGGWIPSTQLTQVFNGVVNYPTGVNTIDITFTTPFNYTGGTLVMMVQRPMDVDYYDSTDNFYAQTIGTNRALRVQADGTAFDPTAPPATTAPSGQFPKTTFVYTGQAINNDLGAMSITGNTTPSAQSASNYTVTIRNNGSIAQSAYTVKLMREGDIEIASVPGTAIQPQTTATFTIPWTPTAVGPTYVYGQVVLTGDEIPTNNNSPHLNVIVQPAGVVAVTVGEGGATGRMPMDMFYRNSLFESIYLSSELNIGGLLTGIQFYNNFSSNLPGMPTNIWVGETNQTDLAADWIPSTQLTQVYNGTVDYPSGANNIAIQFPTPYVYGGGNLVVMVERPMDTQYYSSSDRFVTQAGTIASRTRNIYSDGTDYDPAAPPTDTAEANFPRTTFFFITEGMGTLSGTVTSGGAPVAGATVTVANSTLVTTSAANGAYSFPFIAEGAQVVSATKHGYNVVTHNVTIVEDQTTTQNFVIAPLPQVTVSGRVVASDNPTVGLSGATITLSGYDSYTATTNASGQFTINNVYANQTYQYLVHYTGYADTPGEVVVGTTNVNMGDVIVNEVAYPPNTVVATEAANHSNVVVTWNEPGTGVAAWLHYDSGENDDSIGTGGVADFDVAIRYPASALQDYLGTSLQAVKVWPAQPGTFSLRVWTGGTPDAPGTMVVDQAFTPVLDTYNTVLLTNPVPVNGNEELWFGYRCNVTSGYPAGCDAGPATDGFGNMMYFQGAWSTLLELAPSLNYNWNIQGYVGYGAPTQAAKLTPLAFNAKRYNEGTLAATGFKKNIAATPADPSGITRVRQGYKVWRFIAANQNDQSTWTQLTPNTITALTYTDNAWTPLPPNVYKYAVKAVYTNNVYSNAAISNGVEKDMMGTLAGTVTDFGTGTPISGAIVTAGTYTGTSNAQGQYTFAVRQGSYTVTAVKVGYQNWSQENVTVTGLQTTTLNIQMMEIAFPPYNVVSTEAANFSNVVTTWNAPDPNAEPVEDFETGNLTSFPWVMGGDAPWSVVTNAPHGGTYCAQSGDINDSGMTSIELTRNVIIAGDISFWYKVSSESGWDYLTFYIDGTVMGEWSGTVPWTEATYPVGLGNHTFKWEYSKDGSLSSGDDCGWIDDIAFPSSTPPTALAKNAGFGTANETEQNRALVGYKVYRLLAANQGDESTWTLLTPTNITALTYTDNAWQPLPSGVYKFAVKAVYTNNVLSLPSLSNEIHKGMMGTLTGTITDFGTGSPVQGATVTAGTYSGTTNAAGVYSFGVYQNTYTVTATKTGYQPFSQDNVVITGLQTTTLNIQMMEIAFPPNTVVATEAANYSNVVVTWNEPGTGVAAWIHYDSGENDDSIGTGGAADFDVAIRYPASALQDYAGTSLQAVKVWPAQAGTFSVRVWTGGTPTAPGNMVVDQAFTPVLDTYNTVVLTNPVPVTGTEELWFGYRCNVTSGYPAGCDAGPATDGFGNMMYFQGEWTTLLALAPTLNYNWNIQGYVGYAAPTQMAKLTPLPFNAERYNKGSIAATGIKKNITPTPDTDSERVDRVRLGYKVWRLLSANQGNEATWTQLTPNTITDLTYTDNAWAPLPSGVYKFAVKAIYTNNVLSNAAFSNEVHKGMMGTLTGTVTDFGSGTPIQGAIVTAGTYSGTTNAQGQYSFPVYQGSYTVAAIKPGYQPWTQANVTITGLQTTTLNIQMIEIAFPVYNVVATEAANFSNVVVTWNAPDPNAEPVEDFETGDLTAFPWVMGGNAPWTVVTTEPHGGTYCAQSGDIAASQMTSMETSRNVIIAGNISFWYKVSSESGWDYLTFYLDGTMMGEWSGTIGWTQATYPVALGNHTFKWEYSKDGSVDSGSDCAWIDDISFPSSTAPASFMIKTASDATANQAKNPAFGKESSNPERVLVGYKVWRLLAANQGNEASWTSLTPNPISVLTYTDNAWQPLPSGVYKFAVKAVYTNNVMALAAFSNEIHKGMMGTLTGTCTEFGTNVPLSGVTVTAGDYSGVSNATGNFSFTVYAGTYAVTAAKPGYQTATQAGVVITGLQTTTQNFVLTELTLPPSGVTAALAGNNVNVTWMEPGTGTASWIHYDSGENDDSIGTGGAADFDVAIRYPGSALQDYIGTSLHAVKVWPAQAGTFSLRVWTGGTPDAPGTMVVDQAFTPTLDVYNTVVLSNPVPVTGNEELWFGYRCNVTSGYPAGCDAGPATDGFGNMMYFQGAWSTLLELAPSLNYNWNIQGYVGYGAPDAAPMITLKELPIGSKALPLDPNRSLTGYRVWRLIQGQETNEAAWTVLTPNPITATAYQDTGWGPLPDGTYKWSVKAVYTGGALSPAAFSNAIPKITQIGTIAGIVRNMQNAAISGATVTCGAVTATTNAQGAYSMTVQQGTHSVTASHPNYSPSTQTGVVVITGQTTTVNFQLAPTTTLLEDGFESYADFATTFAPWTCVDVDQSATYTMTGTTWPGSGAAMAFMVFNPASTTPPATTVTPHDGAKLAVAIASTTPPNNDWLITPQVTNPVQLKFWARSLTAQYGLERFKVGVSTTGTAPDNFTIISGANYVQAPVEWTEYTYDLDAYNGNVYVGIQCLSNDAWIFMLDDFEIGGSDAEDPVVPVVATTLKNNFPNPFNPETTIAFSVKDNSPVTIGIYNVKGQLVKTLVNETKAAGNYNVVWNGTDNNGRAVSSGIYYYKMNAGKYSSTKKMIMMK